MQKYKNLIFDLDDTLMDTWGQLVANALEEACSKMINLGLNASIQDDIQYRRQLYKEKSRSNFCEKLVQHFGVQAQSDSEKVISAGNKAFYQRQIFENIEVFPGVHDLLKNLQLSYNLYLVTSGNAETQNQKIKLLDIESYFKCIFCVDPFAGQSKKTAFEKILRTTNTQGSENLSIGNRIDMEICQAKELGMDTCLILHGEYIHLEPSCPEERPDFKLEKATEIIRLLESSVEKIPSNY
ncbi:MAG: HAD family hydrolase [Bdellovibrionota bacterium]